MYEIWLMLNIAWETLLQAWPWVLALGLVIAVTLVMALARGGADWGCATRAALIGAVLVGVVVFLALPGLTRSSLGELKYWVDWLALAGIAAAFAAAAAALLLPLAALRQRRHS